MSALDWEGLNPPYSTIVADPPWHYDEQVGAWDQRSAMYGRTKPMPYSTMDLREISNLPVQMLSMPGSHLYLWTTNRYVRDAYDIASAWGFEPVTLLVWCKTPKGIGPGGRFAITTEYVLFARDTRRAGDLIRRAREGAGIGRADVHRHVRGGEPTGIVYRWEADDCLPTPEDWVRLQQVLPDLANVHLPNVVAPQEGQVETTWFTWPRSAHSVKPAAFFDVVEAVSPSPYVELFARQPRLGWDSWGWGYEEATA